MLLLITNSKSHTRFRYSRGFAGKWSLNESGVVANVFASFAHYNYIFRIFTHKATLIIFLYVVP